MNAAQQVCALSGSAVIGQVKSVNLTPGTSRFSSVEGGEKPWFGFSSEASYLSYILDLLDISQFSMKLIL